MNKKTLIKNVFIITLLVIPATTLSIPLTVTAKKIIQPIQIDQQRCLIIGIGYYHREHEDKIWVSYFEPYWVLYDGRFLGPNDHGFPLTFTHFQGFIIPINHFITPIFGIIDYYPREI